VEGNLAVGGLSSAPSAATAKPPAHPKKTAPMAWPYNILPDSPPAASTSNPGLRPGRPPGSLTGPGLE